MCRDVQTLPQEFWQMQRTNHPHIIKLFDFFQDERYAYFVMEVPADASTGVSIM